MKAFLSKHIYDLLIVLISVLSPVIPILLTIGFLVIVDFIFAIYRQVKQDPSKVTSRKMSNSVSKIATYTLTILAIFFLEKFVLIDILPITKIAAGLICLVELKSIDENFFILRGYSLWSKISKIITRGESNTKNIIDVLDEKD